MSHPTDDTINPDWSAEAEGHPAAAESAVPAEPPPEPEPAPAPVLEIEEQTPDGGHPAAPRHESPAPVASPPEPEPEPAPEPAKAPAPVVAAQAKDKEKDKPKAKAEKPKPAAEAAAPVAAANGAVPAGTDDDDEAPVLVWYVLKVQSSREDTIRDALERRVKIQGLGRYFGRIVVPTEKITEIRNNKKRIVERKTYPGYIMVEMELNEKTWFVVRETPGVGDFVGAHGTPTKMTEAEVNQMLGQETAKTEEAPRVRIDVERGDRVKIKDGPFENFEGTVEEVIEARGLVKVMLIIFNRPTPVDLEYWQVERI
jgi:transcriptional antiterminator NusG